MPDDMIKAAKLSKIVNNPLKPSMYDISYQQNRQKSIRKEQREMKTIDFYKLAMNKVHSIQSDWKTDRVPEDCKK